MGWLDDLLKDKDESQLAWESNKFKKPVDLSSGAKYSWEDVGPVPPSPQEMEQLDPRQEIARREMLDSAFPKDPVRDVAKVPQSYGNDISKMVSDSILSRLDRQKMDRQELVDAQNASNNSNLISDIGRAANQIGAGIAGASRTPETPVYDSIEKNANQPLEKLAMDQKMRAGWDAADPNSDRAKVYKSIMAKAYPGYEKQLSGLSYQDAKDIGNVIEGAEKAKLDNFFKRKELDLKERGLAKEKALSGEDKKAKFQSEQGVKAVQGMVDGLKSGNWTFNLVGDNDFTRNARIAAEMYGRLQSGGSINAQEEQRFMAMLPRASDSRAQQIKKLQNAMGYFQDRVNSFGGASSADRSGASSFSYSDPEKEARYQEFLKKQGG